jgi:acetyltransferase-like isoleucine patch superfamily enzyme
MLKRMGKTLGRIWRVLAWHLPMYQMRVVMFRACGVRIGRGVYIGNLVYLDGEYPEYIEIEDEVAIAPGAIVVAHSAGSPFQARTGVFHEPPKKVLLKRGAWVGVGAIILPGVTVGEGAIVAAGSVVNQNVANYTIVAGNPARPVKKLEGSEMARSGVGDNL